MGSGYLPDTDAGLLEWSGHFAAKIGLSGQDYGLTLEQMSQYTTTQGDYATALATATNPATRTRSAIAGKNAAKTALRDLTRLLVSVIEGHAGLSDAQRLDLGLTVPKHPAPIPAPATAPTLDRLAMSGHQLKIRLHDAATGRRAKPAGVSGAALFSFVGPTPPADLAQWTYRRNTGRTTATIDFDLALSPGTQVWVSAYWVNPRGQPGPSAQPLGALIQFGSPAVGTPAVSTPAVGTPAVGTPAASTSAVGMPAAGGAEQSAGAETRTPLRKAA